MPNKKLCRNSKAINEKNDICGAKDSDQSGTDRARLAYRRLAAFECDIFDPQETFPIDKSSRESKLCSALALPLHSGNVNNYNVAIHNWRHQIAARYAITGSSIANGTNESWNTTGSQKFW